MKNLYDTQMALAERMRKSNERMTKAFTRAWERAMDNNPFFAAYTRAKAEEIEETGGEIMEPITQKYNVYLFDDESPKFDAPLKMFLGVDYSRMVDITESATQFLDLVVVVEKAVDDEDVELTEAKDHGKNEEE